MARIASSPQILEVESQVRLLLNRYLMISVQVAFAQSEGVTQLIQYILLGGNAEPGLPVHFDQRRFPAAVNAPPTIPCEAENTETSVILIVSPLGARATTHIMITLSRAAVLIAGATYSKFSTARGGTWA